MLTEEMLAEPAPGGKPSRGMIASLRRWHDTVGCYAGEIAEPEPEETDVTGTDIHTETATTGGEQHG